MSEKRFSLDVIGVAEPCHEDWSGMTGGEQKKFCDSCEKHVHNLSEMTREEAESFVNDNPTGVCIRFRRDATTGRLLTADLREPALAPLDAAPRSHGRGRFSGRLTSRGRTQSPRPNTSPRRAACRIAGNVFVPVLSVVSLLAGAVAVLVNGGRAPVGGHTGVTMGGISCPPPIQQPKYAATGVGVAPVPAPPAGFLAQTVAVPQQVPDRPLMGRIAVPVEPEPQIMGLICPPEPEPEPQPAPPPKPDPQPAPPEVMGEIEFIMGDIACPEDPAVAVDPIEQPAPEPEVGPAQN